MGAIGPGDLVKCVDDSVHEPHLFWENALVEGRIYRVAGIADPSPCGAPCIHLCGIREPHKNYSGFHLSRFIPIRDDAIDVFRQIVADVPHDDKVTA